MQEQKNWDADNHGQKAHPPPELLMLALDGELQPEEAARIEFHLAACWVCRTRKAQVEGAIRDFIEYNQTILAPHLTPPPNLWRDFDGLLDRRAAELGMPSLFSGLGARLREIFALRRLTPGLLAVVTSGAIVVLAYFWLVRSPIASADELLQRSTRAETERVNHVTEPVMYRKLQISRRSAGAEESVSLESWHSQKNGLFRQRVGDKQGSRFIHADEKSTPGLIAELERVFKANRLDVRQPLSAATYAEWRKTIRLESETVSEVALPEKTRGLKVTTVVAGASAADAITEAALVVRRDDWHPIIEHLKVQGQNEVQEYELREMAYEVMPLAAMTVLAESELAPLPSAAPAVGAIRIPAGPLSSPPMAPSPTEAELTAAEVAAFYALHRMQADLGEQIEILRETRDAGGHVVVRGLVETADRKDQLTAALRGIQLVTIRIQTVEEAQHEALKEVPESRPPQISAELTSADSPIPEIRSTQQPFRTSLEKYFASSGAATSQTSQTITDLTNRSLRLSERALARAWALRRLGENPTLKNIDSLSPEARERLAAMVESHLQGLRDEVRGLRAELETCLTFVAGVTPSGRQQADDKRSDWAKSAMKVFQSVSQLDRLIHELFSASGPAGKPAVSAGQALADFAEIESALRVLESQTSRISVNK